MVRSEWVFRVCVAVVLVVGFGVAPAVAADSAAEALLKVLPDDVVAFVATGGCDAVKGDFEKSILGRIWNDPSTQGFYRPIKAELLALAGRESNDANVPKQIEAILGYVQLLASRPFCVGIARVAVEDGPPICAFAIVDAGERKAEIAAAVSKLEAMVGEGEIGRTQVGSLTMHTVDAPDDVPLYWGWAGNYLVAAVNDGSGAATKHLGSPRPAAWQNLQRIPGGNDVFLAHIDVQKALRFIDAFGRKEGADEEMDMLSAVIKELGLSGVKTTTERVGFSGPDVVVRSLVEMPTPATGLPGTFKPVNPAWFRAVDGRAVQAGAMNWDVAATYDLAMNVVKTISPDDMYPEIQEGIKELESAIQCRIREGLLKSLPGPALYYTLPAGTMAEAPMGGFVAVAKLSDAELFEQTMTSLGKFISAESDGVLQISSQQQDGRTVHVWAVAPLAFAQVMPTWSVADDHVVIGSNSALCNLGVKQLISRGSDGKSLADTDGFKKIRPQLPENLIGLTYTDSAVQFNQMRMQLQQFWPMLTMGAMQAKVKLPVMLPALDHIAKDMGPSVQYSYFGPEGLHSHYRGPGMEMSMGAVAGGAVGAGVLMPALDRARNQARRVASMSNLKQIGVALHMWAEDNDGRFPDELAKLEPYVSGASVWESPRKPKDFSGPSYLHLGGQTRAMNYRNILVYENPEFCSDGVNAVFLDGHVEFLKPEEFRQKLEETCKRLGREVPQITFAK
ncbi:MAG: DUF1559 domain-containing protein [Sedimentisphaerales bacterium]|nr:DUF1559 domain-containing protein [Sedimentisphaerales bacterium]